MGAVDVDGIDCLIINIVSAIDSALMGSTSTVDSLAIIVADESGLNTVASDGKDMPPGIVMLSMCAFVCAISDSAEHACV